MKKIIVFSLVVGFLGVSIPAGLLGVAQAQAGAKFIIGDKVETVRLTRVIAIPSENSSTGYGRNSGYSGWVVDGPRQSSSGDVYTWWKVNFGDLTGWVKENDIKLIYRPTLSPPAISGVAGPRSLSVGIGGTWTVSASDPNGDAMTYSVIWGDGATSSGQSGSSFSHTYSTVGTYTATFTANDGKGGVVSKDLIVAVGVAQAGTKFSKGDTIEVTNAELNVRREPTLSSVMADWNCPNNELCSNVLWTARAGDKGTILSGPVIKDGYTWWRIDYDNADDGWSIEGGFKKIASYGGEAPPSQGGDFTLTASTPARAGGRVNVNWGVLVRAGTSLGVNKNITIELSGPYRDSLHAPKVVATKNFPVADAQAGSSGIDVPSNAVDGIYVARLMFRHGTGSQIQYSAYSNTVLISGAAQAPVISSVQGPTLIKSGQTGTWKVLATDPNNDSLMYFVTWGDGSRQEYLYTPTFSHNYATVGNYSAVFKVINTSAKESSKTVAITISNNDVPPGGGTTVTPIVIVSPASGDTWKMGETRTIQWQSGVSVGSVNIDFRYMDDTAIPLLEPVITRIASNQPGTGSYSWTIPTLNLVSGHDYIYLIKITASSNASIFSSRSVNIVSGGTTPGSPVISSVAGPSALQVGQIGTWTVSATDPNGDALTYSAIWGDGTTSMFQGGSTFTHTYVAVPSGSSNRVTPASVGNPSSGSYTLTFTAKDAGGLTGRWSGMVTVTGSGGGNPTSTPSGNFSVGGRVRLIGSDTVIIEKVPTVNNPSNIEGTQSVDSSPSWAGIGFSDFKTGKGTIIEGPSGSGSDTKWRVDYDYGPDGWTLESKLQSIGIPTGKWGFTSGNVLGRELNTSGGLAIDPYYVSINYQVSMPSSMAQSSLPPAAVTAQAGSGGGWVCRGTYTGSMNPNNFWGDSICRYERGNRAPQANLTGPASAFVGVNGTWQFTAGDEEGALTSYSVNWGDVGSQDSGSLSGATTNKDITHIYTQTGTFTITLAITDGAGLKATATKQVTVTVPCSTRFQKGDGVKVSSFAENGLNVRPTPGGTTVVLGNQQAGSLGAIIDGPQSGVSNGIKYCWWKVDYDAGADGWSAEKVGDQYMLEKVSDGLGTGDGDQIISGNSTGPSRLTVGVNGTWLFTASDPTAQSLTYEVTWDDGQKTEPITVSGGNLSVNVSHSYSAAGFYLIQFKVVNNRGEEDLQLKSVEVVIDDVVIEDDWSANNPPVLATPTGPASVVVNANTSWQVSATDSDSTSLSYTVLWGDGNQNTYPGTSGQPVSISHTYTSLGQKTIQVTVSDGEFSDTKSVTANVAERTVGQGNNNLPVISSVQGLRSLVIGYSGPWTVTASDFDGDVLSYSVNWGDGATSAPQSGSSFSHTYQTVGAYRATFTVADGRGGSVDYAVMITVTVGNTIATTSTPPVPNKFVIGDRVKVTGDYLKVRTNASLAGNANGYRMTGDLGTITEGPWSATDGYIRWKVDYDTGIDGWSAQDWLEKTTGSGPAANRAPVIDNFSGPTTLALSAIGSWRVIATDPDGDAMTYRIGWGDTSFWQNNLNPGPQYAGGLTSGVPRNIDYWFRSAKNYSIILTVTDSKGASVSKTVNVTVASTSNSVPLGGYAPLWNAPDLPPLNNPDKLTTWTGPDERVWAWRAYTGLWQLKFIP